MINNLIPGMKITQTAAQAKAKNESCTLLYFGQKLANVKKVGGTVEVKFKDETVKVNTNEINNYDFRPKAHDCAVENKIAIIKNRLARIESDFID